jgi:CRISPR-associated protein Csd1
MILQALADYYETLVNEGKLGAAGWTKAKVSYAVNIDETGKFRGIQSLMKQDFRGKKEVFVPASKSVPIHPTRSGRMPPPYFLCDNARYMLGAWEETGDENQDVKNKEKAKEYYANAANYHKEILGASDDILAKSVCRFFETWDFEKEKEEIKIDLQDILSAANLVFRSWETSEFIHENEVIRQIWDANYQQSSGDTMGQCLVTGKVQPIARLHPLIKGVYGAQSSGAALVSFNAPAFESYGKEQGANAPVSEYAANAYGAALNYLLSEPKYHKSMGDTTVVYWAHSGNEAYVDFFGACMYDENLEDETKIIQMMASVAKGKLCRFRESDLEPDTEFYILGISPNAARLSVRFFYRNTFQNMIRNIQAHYDRLKIEKPIYEKAEHPSVGAILYETVNKNSKDKAAAPILVGNFYKAVISDERYPQTIFTSIVIRIRSDHIINRNRAAMIKAFLLKNNSNIKEGVVEMKLNETTTDMPYVLGRMFALLEEAQISASPGINTTIKDKFFNSACATPASVFPRLLKLKNSHIKVLAREKKGYAVKIEKQLGELVELIDETLPTYLSLEEQGNFILGYYHQTQKRFEKKES